MNDFSELIKRLNDCAEYSLSLRHRKMMREAATALQSLTSTVAGLEVDAERWRARDQVKLNISLGELKASNGTRWQVCLTRDDMPNDAWPTRTWMFSVFDTAIKEDAEHEVKEWKRFLRAETPKYPQRCEVVDAAISRARG